MKMVKTTSNKNTPSPSIHNSTESQCKKKYKGVRMRSWGSWVSEIRAPSQKTRIWLGSYSTPEAAARAYDVALLCLRGPTANFNFSTSTNSVPRNSDNSIMSPKSIKTLAAAAAANYNFQENPRNNSNPPQSPFSSISCSSSSSSSRYSNSTSNNLTEDDIFSLAGPKMLFSNGDDDDMESSISVMASWYNFDSPKYNEMINGVLFDPNMMMEDNYEDGDIRLWNFH